MSAYLLHVLWGFSRDRTFSGWFQDLLDGSYSFLRGASLHPAE